MKLFKVVVYNFTVSKLYRSQVLVKVLFCKIKLTINNLHVSYLCNFPGRAVLCVYKSHYLIFNSINVVITER